MPEQTQPNIDLSKVALGVLHEFHLRNGDSILSTLATRPVEKSHHPYLLTLTGQYYNGSGRCLRYDSYDIVRVTGATPDGDEINDVACSDAVMTYGVSQGYWDMPKEKANQYCQRLTEETGLRHDWHYVGGRVHIKGIPAEVEALLKERDKYKSDIELLAGKLQIATGCMQDMMLGDDGQAWMEARDHLPRLLETLKAYKG